MSAEPRSHGKSIDCELPKLGNRFSRSRRYRVYLPKDYDQRRNYPMLMVLHGCRQNHIAMQSISGFDAIADRESFVVVYPYVTGYWGIRTKNCWGWWQARQRRRGFGEVADLSRIAEAVARDHSIDQNRLYICGLSSGAAMAVASLVAYSDLWRSGASVGGVPYGESSRSVQISAWLPLRFKSTTTLIRIAQRALFDKAPPLLVVQSQADTVVTAHSGKNLTEIWQHLTGTTSQTPSNISASLRGIDWTLKQYPDESGRLQVASLFLGQIEHGWPGGLPGRFSIADAPNVSEFIWSFFEAEYESINSKHYASESAIRTHNMRDR